MQKEIERKESNYNGTRRQETDFGTFFSDQKTYPHSKSRFFFHCSKKSSLLTLFCTKESYWTIPVNYSIYFQIETEYLLRAKKSKILTTWWVETKDRSGIHALFNINVTRMSMSMSNTKPYRKMNFFFTTHWWERHL